MLKDEDSMKPVLVRFPADLYEAIRQAARDDDRTIAATIRRACKRYLEEGSRADS